MAGGPPAGKFVKRTRATERRQINTPNNKCTITEMGRLLLTGWYYNIENFTKKIYRQIFNAYRYKAENGIQFNDLEFAEAVKHIRENIGYYYHHENELKIYMLEHFFKEYIKPFLPKQPKELEAFAWAVKIIQKEKERIKRDPDYYWQRLDDLESYVTYLEEILEDHGIEYLSLEEYTAQRERNGEEYLERLSEIEREYRKKCAAVLLGSGEAIKMLT
ncbi:MAG: hypothetical protein AB1556_03735 [Bacillota bacterium]